MNRNSQRCSGSTIWRRFGSVLRRWSAAAAAVVLLAFGGYYFHAARDFSRQGERLLSVSVPHGQRVSLTLQDGTSVWLNAGTTLRYPALFTGRERRVEIDGEARFEVVHDAKHPFIVRTYACDVEVLGTKFNVVAEEENGLFSTALFEGRVAVSSRLVPGERLVLEPDEVVTLEGKHLCLGQIDNDEEYLWTNGIISLTDQSFSELMHRFEKTFGVTIRIEREPSIRIGQGIEFDFCSVHCTWAFKKEGYETIIVNNNPETVSTDFDIADKLYFEPLTPEDVESIVDLEKPDGAVVQFGGQTAINLADKLGALGVKIIGTDVAAIEKAENRDCFEKIMEELKIPQPKGRAVTNIEAGIAAAAEIGYPVLVRPSYVLGGRAMQIVRNENALKVYLRSAVEIDEKQPVLVDKYISGKELEVDAICDGKDVFIPGIMEHVERTGIHSGDSISVYPTFSVSDAVKKTIIDYTIRLGLGIGIDRGQPAFFPNRTVPIEIHGILYG